MFLSPRRRALARQEGLEPPTYCLEGSCSILLSYWRMQPGAGSRGPIPREGAREVERVMGIEPTRPAWKAGILPLNYTRIRIIAARRASAIRAHRSTLE